MATLTPPTALHGTVVPPRDFRRVSPALGQVHDRVMFKADASSPEAPFASAIVVLLRRPDWQPAWLGYSDEAGWYTASGLELGVEYVPVALDPARHFKAVAAGPVVAVAP